MFLSKYEYDNTFHIDLKPLFFHLPLAVVILPNLIQNKKSWIGSMYLAFLKEAWVW